MAEQYRIYVATSWNNKEEANAAAEQLRAAGYIVDCRWLSVHDDVPVDDPRRPEFLKEQALNDLEDILNSDVFILLNQFQKRGEETSGKAVEMGFAFATQRPVIMIGEPTNVFHYLDFPQFPDLETAISWMKAREAEAEEEEKDASKLEGAVR